MSEFSSIKDTLEHKQMVTHYMNVIIQELINRAEKHDNSKMLPGEVEYFDEYTPKLKDSTYGSEEYTEFLKQLKPALDHHYGLYRHHPEFEEYNLVIWKDIKDYEGFYQISNYGDVKSLRNNQILKAHITPKGYLRIQLNIDGFSKNFMVHRLVAEAFIKNHPEGKDQVNHKDTNKMNNFSGNLEWCNNSENQLHAYTNNLQEIKYIVHCIELDITTFGCTAMERELKKLGYDKARESGVLACINETTTHHMNLHFEGYKLAEYKRSKLSNMTLLDLVEMFCDWLAATKRHNDGNILKSIDINQKRFGYTKELHNILVNTVDLFEE